MLINRAGPRPEVHSEDRQLLEDKHGELVRALSQCCDALQLSFAAGQLLLSLQWLLALCLHMRAALQLALQLAASASPSCTLEWLHSGDDV